MPMPLPTRRSLFAVRFTACIAMAAATASVLFGAAHSDAAELPAKTLVFCSDASPAGFDPAQYTTSVEFSAAAYTVYNRLVEFEHGGTKVEPGLAQSWEISDDGRVYTFHLRQGVKFHTTPYFKPTREFDADDVVQTFERMRDPNNALRKAYPVAFPYFSDLGLATNLAKVEKIDRYTVRMTLHTASAPFLSELAMPFASIISAEYAGELMHAGKAADLNRYPIGTGPFIFHSYEKDATIRFDGNPDYWKSGVVRLSKLVFEITPDPAVRAEKLKIDECQVMNYPSPADIASLSSDPNLQVPHQVGFNLGFLAYNTTHKPLDNVDVRRALDMAIDKPAIVKSVYQGAGQAAVNPMPPTQWSYDAALKDAPYDPAQAKALLAKAGYPDGLTLTLWAMPVQRPYNPNAKLMAEMLQADWAKIGLKVKIVSYEWGEYIKRTKNGEHDISLIGWTGDNGDPDNWLGTLYSCDAIGGNNYSMWCDPAYDKLIKQAKVVTDRDQRTQLYKQAQQLLKQQVPITPVAHSTVNQPLSAKIEGFKVSPFGRNVFSGVSIEK